MQAARTEKMLRQSLPVSSTGSGRRRSAGDESARPAKRELKKFKTFSPSTGGCDRLSTVKVTPEALKKLHNLHEQHMKTKDPTYFKGADARDLSQVALRAAFAAGTSWQLHALLPEKKTEKPFNKRKLEFWGSQTGALSCSADALRHWGAAMINIKGEKGERDYTIGQDNCSIATLSDGWEVFTVVDGHGPDGQWPSTRASQTLPFFLQSSGCSKMLRGGGFEAALTDAFEKVEQDLEIKAQEEDIQIHFSGCTATVAIRDKVRDDLWVAHVGDSRAILLVPEEGVVYSTQDHKPTLESEVKRLEEMGSFVEHTEYDDGDTEDRIYIRGEEYPGLNMTRSLGDVCVKAYGVIAVPEVHRWDMSDYKIAYYLACSDGVWEFLSNDEVADIVLDGLAAGKSTEKVAEELIEEARTQWALRDATYTDDITVLLIPLDDSTRPTHRQGGCGDCVAGLKKGSCSIM